MLIKQIKNHIYNPDNENIYFIRFSFDSRSILPPLIDPKQAYPSIASPKSMILVSVAS